MHFFLLSALLLSALLFPALRVPAVAAARAADSAPARLIDQSRAAMRSDPETSRRLAEKALAVLAAQPDADLQVRAHLQLCDYYSERDAAAAQTEVAQARALLPRTTQPALRAGLLACEAELHEYAGQNARA
ncbi:MAG TPA: hypothetical protein VFR86_08180, partial [Burkholderiaceae bacterium]|nr:hypothetical protein [Burkholderiaceae bacterium]